MSLRKAAAGGLVRRAGAVLSLLALAAVPVTGQGVQYPQTTFEPVSQYGASQNAVFMNTFWWTMGILMVVVVLTIYVAWRFRERPDSPEPKHIHGHTGLEIAWTVLPALIVVAISVPTIRTIFENQAKAPAGALQIEVIGHQWWWEFRYPEYGVVTANQLYLPVGRPIDLKMHSADVIHSFWIPRIGGKRDVNPQAKAHEGENPSFNHIVFTVDSAGYYAGQCAEYCGDSHAIMRMSAVAVETSAFDAWVEAMRQGDVLAATPADPQTGAAEATMGPPAPPLIGAMPSPTGAGHAVRPPVTDELWAAEGRKLFVGKPCAACHAIAGTTAMGQLGPSLTRFGARPHLGAGALENNLENLTRWIRDPQAVKPGTLMPGIHRGGGNFPPTNLTESEIHALAQYLLSLK